MVWVGLSMIVTKLGSFIAQLVLGWLLAEDDFALYAVAISLTGVIGAVRDGGVSKLLVQRGHEFDRLARAAGQLAMAFNLFAAAVLVLAAPYAAAFYDRPALPPLLWVLALSLPLGTPAMLHKARLQTRMGFERLARLQMGSVVFRYSSIIGFAVAGFGPMAFVLPILITPLYEWGVCFWREGALSRGSVLSWTLARELLLAGRWIMLTAGASALGGGGDFLVIGRLAPEALAVYFFGFQLTVAMSQLFTQSMQAVLLPMFSRLGAEPARQRQGFLKSVRLLTIVSGPACVGAALASPILVHLAWQGKWDASFPVIQVMLVSLALLLISPLGSALLDARARWRTRLLLITLEGIAIVLAAALGAWIGGLIAIALCVGVERAVMGPCICWFAGRDGGGTAITTARAVLPS